MIIGKEFYAAAIDPGLDLIADFGKILMYQVLVLFH
jgi:hypothetical protein